VINQTKSILGVGFVLIGIEKRCFHPEVILMDELREKLNQPPMFEVDYLWKLCDFGKKMR